MGIIRAFGDFVSIIMTDDRMIVLMASIRQRREQLNYSQEYVAGQLNLTQKGYSKIELGRSKLRLDEFLDLCEILEISPRELFNPSL